MADSNRLSLPLRFCCVITSADPEILSQCNNVDKRRIARHAMALMCTFTMASVLWTAVFSEMLSMEAAVAAGMFAGFVIYLFDLAIATSDWDLKGVLRDRATFSLESVRSILVRITKFGCRMVLALTLAVVTGTYFTLFLFNETIENFIHQQRLELNAPIEAEHRIERDKLRGQLIDPLQQDLAMALEQRKGTQKLLGESQDKLARAQEAVTEARLDKHREESGLGRAAGRGPRYRDAEIRLEEAGRHVAMAQAEVEHARANLQEIDARIQTINIRLQEAGEALSTGAALLAAERDARLVPERSDFLMKFRALEELKRDPVYGASMTFVAWLTKLTIVIFEMIFIIILLNDHASLYTLRLLCRTRLDAQRIDEEYVRARAVTGSANVAFGESLSQNAFGEVSGVISKRDQAAAVRFAESHPPDGGQGPGEHGNGGRPIFNVPVNPIEDGTGCDEGPYADSMEDNGEFSGIEEIRYPVVGGKPGERVSNAEAKADRGRYWVNPESPDEIWVREYYEALRGINSSNEDV